MMKGRRMRSAHLWILLAISISTVVITQINLSMRTLVSTQNQHDSQRKILRTAFGANEDFDASSPSAKETVNAHETVLVMRTMAPLHPLVLDRIFELALQVKDSTYDFWILVDETNNNQTEQVLDMYFHMQRGTLNKDYLQPPRIFSVSETILLQHFPRLTSYIHNEPEQNYHKKSGLCCSRPIMWQMFVPTFAIFMQQHTNYRFAWSFEEDISTQG